MELAKDVDEIETFAHLSFNIPEYYEGTKRELVVKLADASSERWSSSDITIKAPTGLPVWPLPLPGFDLIGFLPLI